MHKGTVPPEGYAVTKGDTPPQGFTMSWAPGWYEDPTRQSVSRYWDGQQWTSWARAQEPDSEESPPGYYASPTPGQLPRYWDGNDWTAYTSPLASGAVPPPPPPANGPPLYFPAPPQGTPRRSRAVWGGPVGALLVVIAILYGTGHLDKPLSSVGLNLHPCIKNAFGSTYCGDEAKSYCQSISGLRKLANEPNDVCDQIGVP